MMLVASAGNLEEGALGMSSGRMTLTSSSMLKEIQDLAHRLEYTMINNQRLSRVAPVLND